MGNVDRFLPHVFPATLDVLRFQVFYEDQDKRKEG